MASSLLSACYSLGPASFYRVGRSLGLSYLFHVLKPSEITIPSRLIKKFALKSILFGEISHWSYTIIAKIHYNNGSCVHKILLSMRSRAQAKLGIKVHNEVALTWLGRRPSFQESKMHFFLASCMPEVFMPLNKSLA